MPLMRYKNHPEDVRNLNSFNPMGFEILTGDDSAYISDLEVFLPDKNEWKCASQAFKDKDLIPNNYNTMFKLASTQEEKDRGWF